MNVALPGETDAAMKLNSAAAGVNGHIAGARFRHPGYSQCLRISHIDSTGCIIGQRSGIIDFNHEIDQRVLDRLEEAQRAVELNPGLRVLGCRLQQPLTSTRHIRREHGEHGWQRGMQRAITLTRCRQLNGWH